MNGSNGFLAVTYREDDQWLLANDPVDSGTSSGSPWPLFANSLIQNQSIPLGFITVAEGSTGINLWQKGQTWYDAMYDQVTEATNGTMKIKTVLFFQGETDMLTTSSTAGNYTLYKNNLSYFLTSVLDDFIFSDKVLIAQIGHLASTNNRGTTDNIRKAQLDFCNENDRISLFPTYDIGPHSDNVHFKSDEELQELADRWWGITGELVYGLGDGTGPKINNITMDEGDNDTLILNFTESSLPLKIEYWNGTTNSKAQGFYFILQNGTSVGDDLVNSTSVINNYQLQINLTQNVTSEMTVTLGGFSDGVAKPIIRDSSTYAIPAETFYNFSIYYSRIVASGSAENSNTNTGGSTGLGTYRPSENALQNGWRINVAKNQKVQIPLSGSKKNIEIKSVEGDKVIVSVDGSDYEISNLSSGKIDLDDDGFYDVEITNNGVTGSYANLEFKLIHEEVPSEQEEIQGQNIIEKIPETLKKVNWKVYVLVGGVIILIVIWIVLKKKK